MVTLRLTMVMVIIFEYGVDMRLLDHYWSYDCWQTRWKFICRTWHTHMRKMHKKVSFHSTHPDRLKVVMISQFILCAYSHLLHCHFSFLLTFLFSGLLAVFWWVCVVCVVSNSSSFRNVIFSYERYTRKYSNWGVFLLLVFSCQLFFSRLYTIERVLLHILFRWMFFSSLSLSLL